jgi:transcriptional regulator with PAS, ATPase and Fis domain
MFASNIEAARFQSTSNASGIFDRALNDDFSIKNVFDEVARHYLPRALEQAGGNRTQAAKLLGLSNYQTLKNWMERHAIKL